MDHTRPWITAGVALVGAGVIAITPVTPTVGALTVVNVPNIQLTATDIVLDLVRHGESVDNAEHILGTLPPGAPITTEGAEQAAYLADPANPQQLADPSFYAGIYASEFLRTQQTAAEWLLAAGAPDTPVTVLAGLNEINAGWFEGGDTLAQVAYAFAPLMWLMGHYWVPMLGSTIDPNGVAFNDRVTDAIEAIYGNTVSDADGSLNDVAFGHGMSIAIWTLMNVKNPDFGLVIDQVLDTRLPVVNTGQVVIEGNPTDGWTLVSWQGEEVAATPDLATGLFVAWRDLNVAPQIATWNFLEALQGGDQAEILAALQSGFNDVLAAFAAFPQAVLDAITGSLGDATAGSADASADMIGDVAAALAG